MYRNSSHGLLVRSHARRQRTPRVPVLVLARRFIFLLYRSLYPVYLFASTPLLSPAAQPPHRLSSIDDPYALTLSATASPRQSVASSLNSSPANSYARVAHDDPDHPAMPLNQHQQGYSNMEQPYSNQAFNSSAWLEKEQARSRRSKWIVSFISFPLYTAYRIASPS